MAVKIVRDLLDAAEKFNELSPQARLLAIELFEEHHPKRLYGALTQAWNHARPRLK